MVKAIDHVVVAVNDLDRSIQDYRQLGFTVTIGGDHAHGASHNALIAFQDGSYVELIAFKPGLEHIDHRWRNLLAAGEGFVDFAVASSDLDSESDMLRQAELPATGPHDGGRVRPDGVDLRWRSTMIDEFNGVRLPFLIEDVTPRTLRVASGTAAVHPNGATGIAGVTIVVDTLAEASPLYTALFGTRSAGTPSQSDCFLVGTQLIKVMEADSANSPLESRPSGLQEVQLTDVSTDFAPGGILPVGLVHGAIFTASPRN